MMQRPAVALLCLSLVQPLGGEQDKGNSKDGYKGAPDVPQVAPLHHTSPDPYKCKVCAPALEKALGYLELHKGDKSPFGEGYTRIFTGYLWMAEGRHPAEFARDVRAVSGGFYKGGGFNGNWAIAMSALFMAEAYRRAPSEKLREALIDSLKVAEAAMEPKTGGWCHHLNYGYESGYGNKGGGFDLGIVTAQMYAAMLEMKSLGIPVDAKFLAKVQGNLDSLSDGQGICYGTGNTVHDVCESRAAFAYLGMAASNAFDLKFASKIPAALKARYKDTHKGHGYPPIHFVSVALAMHLLGPEMYDLFATQWIDPLISLQKEDGSIELPHSEHGTVQPTDKFIAGTAAFALVLVLQQPGAFNRDLPKTRKSPGSQGGTETRSDAKPFLGLRANAFAGTLEILKITEKGPSEAAGFFVNDLIVEFRGSKIEKGSDLRKELEKCSPGQRVTLVVVRGGEIKKIDVKLGALEKPKDKGVETAPPKDFEEGEGF